MSRDDVVAVLRLAREQIAAGWIQRAFASLDGVCGGRAVNDAIKAHLNVAHMSTDPQAGRLYWDTVEALKAHLPAGFTGLIQFNDNCHTRHEDMLTLFDKTLADLGGLLSECVGHS